MRELIMKEEISNQGINWSTSKHIETIEDLSDFIIPAGKNYFSGVEPHEIELNLISKRSNNTIFSYGFGNETDELICMLTYPNIEPGFKQMEACYEGILFISTDVLMLTPLWPKNNLSYQYLFMKRAERSNYSEWIKSQYFIKADNENYNTYTIHDCDTFRITNDDEAIFSMMSMGYNRIEGSTNWEYEF